jgi:hypothetical protein
MTKNTTNVAAGMAMIYVPTPEVIGFWRFAYRAQAFLFREHFFVLFRSNPVFSLEMVSPGCCFSFSLRQGCAAVALLDYLIFTVSKVPSCLSGLRRP